MARNYNTHLSDNQRHGYSQVTNIHMSYLNNACQYLTSIYLCILLFYLTFILQFIDYYKYFIVILMLVFFYYNDTVQRHEQRCCWNGAVEKINIIIIIIH